MKVEHDRTVGAGNVGLDGCQNIVEEVVVVNLRVEA